MLSLEEINSNGHLPFVKKRLTGNVHKKNWYAELPTARNFCDSTTVIIRTITGNRNYADDAPAEKDYSFRYIIQKIGKNYHNFFTIKQVYILYWIKNTDSHTSP